MSLLKFLDSSNNEFLINQAILQFIINIFGLPHLGTRIRIKLLAQALDRIKFTGSGKVLDAGCGYGFISLSLARQKLKVVAIDTDIQRLTVAKRLAKMNNIRISFLKANLYHLPFANNQFDLCVCFEVLEHLRNDLKAMKELSRVVKAGGHIIVSVPQKDANKVGFEKFHHIRAGYTVSELRNLAKKIGFRLDCIFPYAKTRLGKAVLNINFAFSQFVPIFSFITFPISYPLLLIDQYFSAKEEPSAFVAVLTKY